MIKNKYFNIICILGLLLAIILTCGLLSDNHLGVQSSIKAPPYETRLFNQKIVHNINLIVSDWEHFIENAKQEEYISCDIEIDGETFYNVGLRVKGNNSKSLTSKYNLSRYSLKIEFDHFSPGYNYYGLDKLSLDASFQDNSYLKTYLTFDMMRFLEIPTSLCSYTWVSVNDTDWGLYLAVEEPEEAFLSRNFGKNHGKLYKPDYRSLNDPNEDIALKYIDDNPKNYANIFENAKTKIDKSDEERIINALKTLSTKKNLETVINIDEVIRYFTVQVFVMNWDSYIGHTGHNYLLYEEDGLLSMLPWDYNLAFGTYALGKTDPVRDPNILINYPINTPAEGQVMLNRPLYHNLMGHKSNMQLYHSYFDLLISQYFESSRFEIQLMNTVKMIAPYVKKDPTAFCSYDDFLLGVDTLKEVCYLRSKSIRGQLDGKYPITLKEQSAKRKLKIDASHIDLRDLGDFDDLENSKERQDLAMLKVKFNSNN